VYQLEVPTDKKETVETALLILEDWAQGLTMDAKEIDKERGVILEEWRLGRGAQARIRDLHYPALLSGSLYAERLPIGKPEVFTNAPRESLVRYYRDWYRPDLMAVVAVGDFDPDEMEGLIRSRFSRLVMPPDPRPRVSPAVPSHGKTIVSTATDPELTRTTLGIYVKRDYSAPQTIGDIKERFAENLFFSLINSRFDEISRKPEAPFLYAVAGSTGLTRPKNMYYLAAAVEEAEIQEGYEALVREVYRVRTHGFTPSELERGKAEFLRRSQQVLRETDSLSSGVFVSSYVNNYLEGSPMAGPEYSHRMAELYVPEIGMAELLKYADLYLAEADRVVLIGAPEKYKDALPGAEAVLAFIASAASGPIEVYEDDMPEGALLAKMVSPGTVRRVETDRGRALGAVEWVLGNGARVVLKTTDFKSDEILMAAYSLGGTSLAEDAVFLSADNSPAILSRGGLGNFSQTQLEKYLSDKQIGLEAYLGPLTEGLQGSASVRDMETFFQLLHLQFTAPRLDEAAAEVYLRQTRASLRNRENRPEAVYSDALQEILGQGHFRKRPLKPEMINEIKLRDAYEFFKDRFADAGDFTFLFVGNVSPETLEPFLASYLASLPGGKRTETFRDTGVRLPRGRVEREVRAGIEDKSLVSLVFTGDFSWSSDNRFFINMMTEYLDLRLREILREDQGGTYGVSVYSDVTRYPAPEYSLYISFGTSPERVEDLVALTLGELERLKKELPEERDIAKIREQTLRLHERRLKENGYWLNSMRDAYFHELPGDGADRVPKLARALTAGDLQRMIARYVDPDNLIRAVLLPAVR
jgi:zinc protease